MASALVKKAALTLPVLLASLVPSPSTCQHYGDKNVTEAAANASTASTERSERPTRVTTPLPPYHPATIGSRGPVYEGTFRACSSHKDCLPNECCIYGLSRGDSCVKQSKPCPVVEVPTRPQPRFCPPYNSGGYFYNVCSDPVDCPYPYLCCQVRGSYLCVPSFYDRRRRRRRRR